MKRERQGVRSIWLSLAAGPIAEPQTHCRQAMQTLSRSHLCPASLFQDTMGSQRPNSIRALGVEGCRAQCQPHGLTGLAAKFKCAGVSCILRVLWEAALCRFTRHKVPVPVRVPLRTICDFQLQVHSAVRQCERRRQQALPQTIGSVLFSSS